jgi:hypothetical protein
VVGFCLLAAAFIYSRLIHPRTLSIVFDIASSLINGRRTFPRAGAQPYFVIR